jgi:hypothetical protein
MTRTADPRGANRRGNDNHDLGYGNIDGTGARVRFPHQPRPAAVVVCEGVHEYWYGGVIMCRCERHAPPGAAMASVTSTARCVVCVLEGGA